MSQNKRLRKYIDVALIFDEKIADEVAYYRKKHPKSSKTSVERFRKKVEEKLRPQRDLANYLLPGLKRFVRKSPERVCAMGEDRRVVSIAWMMAGEYLPRLK